MSLDLSLENPEINFKSDRAKAVVYEFADFRLHTEGRLLLRNGEELPLTPKAVDTLCVLVERSTELVTKQELMRRIWPDAFVEESNLAQYLHVLRKTLGTMDDGRPYIETLKRRGYRFNAEVRVAGNGSQRSFPEPPDGRHARTTSEGVSGKTDAARPSSRFVLVAVTLTGCVLLSLLFLGASGWFDHHELPQSAGDVIVTPLTGGENVTQTTISHDGGYFAYVDYDGDRSRLRLQAVDGSSRSEILPQLAGRIENLSFSPDDAQIYFVVIGSGAMQDGLYRVSIRGGEPTKVFETVTSPVSFSSSGSEMVFVRTKPGDGRQQIVEASADGSGETVLVESPDDERISPNAALSHNGKFVIFGTTTRNFPSVCSLIKLDLQDLSITPVTDEKWDSCYRIAFTRDDKGIAFVGTRRNEAFSTRRDQIYYLEFGWPESRRLTADGNWHDPMSLGMTDAGEIIALPLNRISQLWTMDANGSASSAVQITQGQSDGRGGIVPTPDGKIEFLARDGDGFAIFEANGEGQERRRIVGAATMQELRSNAEARFLVFAEQDNELAQLFRADRNGGDLRQLTFGNSAKIDSSVSPDGNWIIFGDTAFDGTKVTNSLQRIPAEGGPPQMISNDYCGAPHFSNDGRFISCSWPERITILSAETGETVHKLVPELPFVSNSGARWSPDDKSIVYRVVKDGATNLWRQSVGGRPEPLTRFPKGELYNFAYSYDGKKLYLSRGAQIRNAILIKGFR